MNKSARLRAQVERTEKLAASKRARKIRHRSEFNLANLIPTMRGPAQPNAAWSWSIPEIMNARDAQMTGNFLGPVKLAESFATDDACFVAKQNRLAPQRCLEVELQPGKGPRAAQVCGEAEAIYGKRGVGLSPETSAELNRTLADHGFAIYVNIWTPRPDGSRIDVEIKPWPLEFVFWHPAARCLVTRVDPFPTIDNAWMIGLPKDYYSNPRVPSNLIPIVPNDGRWGLISKTEMNPWKHDAALLSTALVFAAHAFGIRDWSKNSASHGSSKVVGELPQGFDLNPDSVHTKAFLELVQDIAGGENPWGLKPFGSKVEVLANPSDMWKVFETLVLNREKAVHRIYCGTDAALGAQGGAPGQDIEALFGVSSTIIQGDLGALERGIYFGSICPWAAINYGDSSQAPYRKYLVPDTDAAIRNDQIAKQQNAYLAALAQMQSARIPITQELADKLAKAYDAVPITVAAAPPAAPGEAPAQPLSVVR